MVVCFWGHRTITDKEQVRAKLLNVISALVEKGADTFLFGSKSDFDFLCWEVVTKLKEQYPSLKRISYNAPHETSFTSKEEREHNERFFSEMLHREVLCADYEKSVNSLKSIGANKSAYIMRNREMIERSDVCVFYYNKDYLPPKRKQSKRSAVDYQSKSGTAIAFAYALQKKKIILNLYQKSVDSALFS